MGELATVNPRLEDLPEANVLLGWADQARRLGVMANADTPADARRRWPWAPGASVCAAPSICSWTPIACPPCARCCSTRRPLRNGAGEHGDRHIDPLANPFMNPEVSDIQGAVVDFYQALDRVKLLQTNDFRASCALCRAAR